MHSVILKYYTELLMKCLREKEEKEMESTRVASLLLLLSTGGKAHKTHNSNKPLARLFECKTCNRRFPSFQALGGHRTSHKRPSVRDFQRSQRKSLKLKPKVHQCPVCGSQFPMGQALGGHMRRHKPTADAFSQSHQEKKAGAAKMLLQDLNLPPWDN